MDHAKEFEPIESGRGKEGGRRRENGREEKSRR